MTLITSAFLALQNGCRSPKTYTSSEVDSSVRWPQTRVAMLKSIAVWIRFVLLVFGGQGQVALENAALRQQLAVPNETYGGQNGMIAIDCFGSVCA